MVQACQGLVLWIFLPMLHEGPLTFELQIDTDKNTTEWLWTQYIVHKTMHLYNAWLIYVVMRFTLKWKRKKNWPCIMKIGIYYRIQSNNITVCNWKIKIIIKNIIKHLEKIKIIETLQKGICSKFLKHLSHSIINYTKF